MLGQLASSGETAYAYEILFGKDNVKRKLVRFRLRQKDNITTDFS
jgi:hypothetical protein